MTDEAIRVNALFPGNRGGPIESTKRAVILALREAVSGSTLNNLVNGDRLTVDMEYPMVEERYPGIWVQFSFTKMANSGVGWELLSKTVEDEGTDEEWVNWEPVREFTFEGRVTLSIVALTSLERDRIADAIVTMLLFSRVPEHVITRADRDTKQFRQLIGALAENPYISMSINTDVLNPGGQAVTTGVPWDSEILGYEDSYSFDLLGQTNIVFRNDGSFSLTRIDVVPEAVPYDRFSWQ